MKHPKYFTESERLAAELAAPSDVPSPDEIAALLDAGRDLVRGAARDKPNAILISRAHHDWMRERTPLSLRMFTEGWRPSTAQERHQLEEEKRRLFVKIGVSKPPAHSASDF